MKVGDLVKIERAYGAKGIIIGIREEVNRLNLIYDVWLFEIDNRQGSKKIFTFMKSQLEVINQ